MWEISSSHHYLNLGFLVFFGSCDQFQDLSKTMKIFGWINGKIHGKQSVIKSNSNSLPNVCEKEEFSDWPNGLLAIGTFGNNNSVKNADKSSNNNIQESEEDDHQDQELTDEEAGELSKELMLLVHNNGSEKDRVTLKKLFDCLEITESSGKEESTKNGKEIQLENTNISKKSLSFILKKAILCRGGFTPPPPPLPLRERFPVETKFEKSRMEKILRAILHKKIYPQASNPKAATKKYMDNNNNNNNLYLCDYDSEEDEAMGKANEGSKWVKTDSDFIVLEI